MVCTTASKISIVIIDYPLSRSRAKQNHLLNGECLRWVESEPLGLGHLLNRIRKPDLRWIAYCLEKGGRSLTPTLSRRLLNRYARTNPNRLGHVDIQKVKCNHPESWVGLP